MKPNHNSNIGSVSTGTLRPEDLIPTFISELRRQKPLARRHRRLVREINARMNAEDYFTLEDADFDLEELTEALNEYAPPGFYFGSHPGDGADFGYWLSESFAEDFDGLRVSDTSEVPTGFTGEVLHINDHGNLTLYSYSRGRRREVWAIV
jgi:hypothetical protein